MAEVTDHSDKKLYLVSCSLEIEMLVLAHTEDQAIRIPQMTITEWLTLKAIG